MSVFAETGALPPIRIFDGVLGRVVHGRLVTLAVIELDADRIIPEHSHENEQLGLIVAGSITFRVGGETRELGPGGTWRILANTPHEARAGREGAVVVEVFSPPRADWEQLDRLEPASPRWPDLI